jgi:hypothetical protein
MKNTVKIEGLSWQFESIKSRRCEFLMLFCISYLILYFDMDIHPFTQQDFKRRLLISCQTGNHLPHDFSMHPSIHPHRTTKIRASI